MTLIYGQHSSNYLIFARGSNKAVANTISIVSTLETVKARMEAHTVSIREDNTVKKQIKVQSLARALV